MLTFCLMAMASEPAPDVPAAQQALLHLAKAFEAGVARCPLPDTVTGSALRLRGFPIVLDADGRSLLVLADQERRHSLSVDGLDQALWLSWDEATPGVTGPCTAKVGVEPPLSGGIRMSVESLDADGNPIPMSKVDIQSESGFRYGSVKREFDAALADTTLPDEHRAFVEAWRDDWFPTP